MPRTKLRTKTREVTFSRLVAVPYLDTEAPRPASLLGSGPPKNPVPVLPFLEGKRRYCDLPVLKMELFFPFSWPEPSTTELLC